MKEVRIFTEETFYFENRWTKRHGDEKVIIFPMGYDEEKLNIHFSETPVNEYGEVYQENEYEVNKVPFFIVREYYGPALEFYTETLYIIPSKFNDSQKFREEWKECLRNFMYRDEFLYIPETNVVVVCEVNKNMKFLYVGEEVRNTRNLRKWLKKNNHI
jgi:hypothetical protein